MSLPVELHGSRLAGGFTLIELAVVMLVIGLLAGGILATGAALQQLNEERQAQRDMVHIREALIGYALSGAVPRLPCPDLDNDGLEDRLGSNCLAQSGMLPWRTLGLGVRDPWGQRYSYHVDPGFSASAGIDLLTYGSLRVCTDDACTTVIAEDIPLVVLSHGRNGYGAWRDDGSMNAAPASVHELENTNNTNDFVFHVRSEPGGSQGEFDDILVWLSGHRLKYHLVRAARLP